MSGFKVRTRHELPHDNLGPHHHLCQPARDAVLLFSNCRFVQTSITRSIFRCAILWALPAHMEPQRAFAVQLRAAGSLANTLAGCALLERAFHSASSHAAATTPSHAQIAMAGPIGDDHLGDFFRSHFAATGVAWVQPAQANTGTGTVVVLTTPDAQRSFLSYPGPPTPFEVSGALQATIGAARCLVIEGYLWELPGAAETIATAIAAAKASGCTVAMTTADVTVVRKYREQMLAALRDVAVLFTNADEAAALVGDSGVVDAAAAAAVAPGRGHAMSGLLEAAAACGRWDDEAADAIFAAAPCARVDTSGAAAPAATGAAEAAALQLGRLCSIAVVTDGSRGSCVTALGQLHTIPPHWARDAPVDTCGAGDAYAAGFLHGFLSGLTVRQMGEFASATASAVIAHEGPQLRERDATRLAASWRACERAAREVRGGEREAGLLWLSGNSAEQLNGVPAY